jgi:hypothetical protein
VLTARAKVLAKAPDEQPAALLEWFRHFAALDTIELQPGKTTDTEQVVPFPFGDDEPLVLANVANVTLEGKTGDWKLTKADVDLTPRRSHVATMTIEELLCGHLFAGGGNGGGGGSGGGPVDAGGPRVDTAELDRTAGTVTITVTKALDEPSVDRDAFGASFYGASGWESVQIGSATPSNGGKTVTIKLRAAPGNDRVRFIARGTGLEPLLDTDGIPLAGGTDSPPGSVHDGHDYVHMFTT